MHAGGIDQPVVVMRTGYNGSSSPITVYPHQNWRGLFELGTDINGNQLSSPQIAWPGARATVDGEIGNKTDGAIWFGGLIPGKADGSGLQYMRNRYYDPATGRFTQEDPIGLAGGMNVYGFAGGDPINFSDPFGLCPFTKSDESCYQELANWGARSGRTWAVNLGAALEAGAAAGDALMGGGCDGEAACGMGVPGNPRGLITGAKHVVSVATQRVTAGYTDKALLKVYRGAIDQINRHKEILKKASPEQVNSINKDIVKHEKRLQAAVEEMQRRGVQP